VLAPVRGLFTYRLPPEFSLGAAPGMRVRVPFGRRELTGFVVDRTSEPPEAIEIREVQGLPDGDGEPLLPEPLFQLLLWAADYYLHPPGEVLKAALPRGLFLPPPTRRRRKPAAPEPEAAAEEPDRQPSAAQKVAGETIDQALTTGGFAPFLLQGVTGSGKTEVYLRAIERALELGKSALVLVPEISLTPQLVARFQGRLGHTLALLHSGLGPSARLEAWRRLRAGTARVAVGVRAAVFAPIPNLGLIVVDEEHDPSFKQEDGFCYQARDMAVARAKFERCAVVLGSATPSLESYANAAAGRYRKLRLPERIDARPMPSVELLDLCRQRSSPPELLLEPLRDAVSDVLARGEQAILFLNRRGHTGCLLCRSCGAVQTCPNCSVALTQHRARHCLLCHYCGHQRPVPTACPECRGALTPLGAGTERVEEEIARLFPEARLGRIDSDCSSRTVEQTLSAFGKGELDLLVGTQVVAKGHDFPGVTLVGVILADSGLHFPDFRAAERSFQLLVQVAGRAGRGTRPGRVLVQTFHPDHPVIVCAARQDYEAFALAELDRRRALGFPPSGRLCAIRVDAVKPVAAEAAARELARLAGDRLRLSRGRAAVLGPAPAPLMKLRGRTRWQLLIRGESHRQIRDLVRPLQDALLTLGPVRVAFDMDPLAML
jgi:primosomal protein N' (replication factor Y) (superfamily II helicase)